MPYLDPRSDGLVAAWSGNPDTERLAAVAGALFDAVVLDMQHGLYDTAGVHEGIVAAAGVGTPTLVRVPFGDLGFVSRALDFGAAGVILPMIEGAEDARAFVGVAKYPPLGQRSFGPVRAVRVHGAADARAYVETANHRTLAIAMIETRSAFEALDAILAVEGLDGVLVGPADLSIALTGRLDPDGSTVVDAAAEIAGRTKAAGKLASIYVSGAEAARRARTQGFGLVFAAVDDLAGTEDAAQFANGLRSEH